MIEFLFTGANNHPQLLVILDIPTFATIVDQAMRSYEDLQLEHICPKSGTSIAQGLLARKLDWSSFPPLLRPYEGGKLPIKRAEKKCQQLENLALSVIELAEMRGSSRDLKIVDFCSGGGHLALLLAYLLPQSTIYLVENKPESLERAIKRSQGLRLDNCRFFQGKVSNLLTELLMTLFRH